MALFPLKDDTPLKNVSFQYVTVSLIGLNVVLFLWELSYGPDLDALVYSLGAIPAVVFGLAELPPQLAIVPAWMTLFTSIFLHGGWMHLIGNMLFLWIFGDNVEDSMGHLRYLVFYLLCGVLATLMHGAAQPSSDMPVVGASGAISGVLGAYLVLHPRARLLVLFMNIIPLRLPAFIVLGSWIFLQVVGLNQGAGSDVAWWAHIGGFIAGALLIVPFRRRGVPLFDTVAADPLVIERQERRHARSIFPNTVDPRLRRTRPWGD
jgi:membrane associated rhomboid family serine protease